MKQFSRQYQDYFEVSAKTGEGISDALEQLVNYVLIHRNPAISVSLNSLKLNIIFILPITVKVEGYEGIEETFNKEIRSSNSCNCNCKKCRKCVTKDLRRHEEKKKKFSFLCI